MEAVVVWIDVAKAGLHVNAVPVGEAFAVGRDAAGIDTLVERLRPRTPAVMTIEATGEGDVAEPAGSEGAAQGRRLDGPSIRASTGAVV